MKKLYSRHFDVDFYEKDAATWVVASHLVDDAHDITTETEVEVPGMVIRDARISFARYPIDVCPMIERNVKRIIGLNVMTNYGRRSIFIFLGSKGCGNVMQILSTGLHAFIYTYYPHLVRTGQMTSAAWEEISTTRLRKACLAHTMLSKGKARMLHGRTAPQGTP